MLALWGSTKEALTLQDLQPDVVPAGLDRLSLDPEVGEPVSDGPRHVADNPESALPDGLDQFPPRKELVLLTITKGVKVHNKA